MFLTSPTGIQDNEKMENTTTYQVVEIMPHNNMIFELSLHSPLKSVGLLHSCEVYDVMMHNDEQERCKRCVVAVRAFRTGDWLHSDAMSYFLNIMKRLFEATAGASSLFGKIMSTNIINTQTSDDQDNPKQNRCTVEDTPTHLTLCKKYQMSSTSSSQSCKANWLLF